MPTTHVYECTQCGHQVLTGTTEFNALEGTASDMYRRGMCNGCEEKRRQMKQSEKRKPAMFRLRS